MAIATLAKVYNNPDVFTGDYIAVSEYILGTLTWCWMKPEACMKASWLKCDMDEMPMKEAEDYLGLLASVGL